MIPFPWLTGISYTLGWKLCNEGKRFILLKTCITQGFQGDAWGARAAEFFWVCTDPKSSVFPAALSHGNVGVIWHSYSESSVSERFWCGSCFKELPWTVVLDMNKIKRAHSITERLSATRCWNGFACMHLPFSSLSISAVRKDLSEAALGNDHAHDWEW